jgi:uncharacterized protein (DUF488 family)
VIAKLRAAGVKVVVDVRAVAASRRAGFSKTMLRASLAAEGIGYEHSVVSARPSRGGRLPVRAYCGDEAIFAHT